MRIHKKVLSVDTGNWLVCCWDDCEKQGYELHKVRIREPEQLIQFVFCSERHRQYFINSHIQYGSLPAGQKLVL